MHYIRPNQFSGADADTNIGIPQIIFCENVMPSSYGYQSIAFDTAIQSTGNADFDNAFYLRDAGEARTLFVPGVVGTTCKRYTYDQSTNIWSSSSKTIPDSAKITVANLKHRTFVHAAFDDEFWEWNAGWSNVTLTGLTAANIQGLVSANAYLIAYDYDTIYYSSVSDPTDFLPSLITGAGSQKILANKGRIKVCQPIDDGFIIYTTENAIIARFSGNIRFPWVFKEIKNSSGTETQEHTTSAGNGSNYFHYSTDGMMVLGPIKTEQEFPTLNEFLSARKIEAFNSTTNKIDITFLTNKPNIKITYIASRWLVISYGQTTLTHALIFDTSLKRWGKVRLDHVAAFEFSGNPGTAGSTVALKWSQLAGTWAQQNNTWAEYGAIISGGSGSLNVPYRSLGFLRADGQVKVINFDYANTNDDAIAMLGRIQFMRDRRFTLQEIWAEVIKRIANVNNLEVWSSHDGKSIAKKIIPYLEPIKIINALAQGSDETMHWKSKIEAQSHTLVFKKNFNLNTVIARGTLGGKR